MQARRHRHKSLIFRNHFIGLSAKVRYVTFTFTSSLTFQVCDVSMGLNTQFSSLLSLIGLIVEDLSFQQFLLAGI